MTVSIAQLAWRERAAAAAFCRAVEGSPEHEAAFTEMVAAECDLLAAVATSPSEMAVQLEFVVNDGSNGLEDNARAAVARIAASLRAMSS